MLLVKPSEQNCSVLHHLLKLCLQLQHERRALLKHTSQIKLEHGPAYPTAHGTATTFGYDSRFGSIQLPSPLRSPPRYTLNWPALRRPFLLLPVLLHLGGTLTSSGPFICPFTTCGVRTFVSRHRPFFVSVNTETLFRGEAQTQLLMMNILTPTLLRPVTRHRGASWVAELAKHHCCQYDTGNPLGRPLPVSIQANRTGGLRSEGVEVVRKAQVLYPTAPSRLWRMFQDSQWMPETTDGAESSPYSYRKCFSCTYTPVHADTLNAPGLARAEASAAWSCCHHLPTSAWKRPRHDKRSPCT